MSLINQVLKDLEQRHATEAQSAKAGLEDLQYVHEPAKPAPRSTPWIIFASILVGLGVLTVVGSYLVPSSDHGSLFSSTSDNALTAAITTSPQIPKQAGIEPAVAQKPETTQSAVTEAMKTGTQQSTAIPTSVVQPTRSTAIVADEAAGTASRAFIQSPVEVVEPPVDTSVVKKNPVPLRSDQKAELAYQSGHSALRAQQYRQAEKSLRAALALEPGHIRARELLTGLYIKQGRWVEASEILRHGVLVSPEHNPFRKLYARALMQMQQHSAAVDVLTTRAPAVNEDPGHYAILAALYQRQNKHASAAKTYSEILKVRPKMGIWWVGMGISLEAMGEHGQAAQAYQLARQSGSLHGDVARYTDNRLLALEALDYPLD